MSLRIRDSLSGRTHRLRAVRGRPLTLYVCGPTVYDVAHVGHGRTYLYFDLVRRLLREDGVPVRHVMNITNVEDKITARAQALGIPWQELSRREEIRFCEDLAGLGILPAHVRPRASEYVGRMVAVAKRLERTGRVRKTDEGYLYSPDPSHADENFPVGPQLERHAVPEPGHPIDAAVGALDFLVWKPQDPPLPSFPSPWGPGVPGWHLECFTMADDLLGLPVDLHGGGMDLIFPHHYAENEVALELQHTPFATTLVHTAFVTEDGRKMSKSAGHLVPLRTALDTAGRDALRWYLMGPPYSVRLEWSLVGLEKARREFDRVAGTIRRSLGMSGGTLRASRYETAATAVAVAMEDGLRSHDALGHVRALADDIERAATPTVARGEGPTARRAARSIERLLGLALADPT
jgi:cysteinyl-tRNA synthetase